MHISLFKNYSVVFILAASLILSSCSGEKSTAGNTTASTEKKETSATNKEKPKPEVATADENKLASLLEASKGKVTVLNFWATWCPPCVKEMPEFAKFYNEYGDQVEFISLSANDPEKISEEVVPYHSKEKLPFPVFVLSANDPDAFYTALRIELSGALPATIIYDKKGIPVEVWEKDTTFEELKAAITPLL